jgi:hypothetical protein
MRCFEKSYEFSVYIKSEKFYDQLSIHLFTRKSLSHKVTCNHISALFTQHDLY